MRQRSRWASKDSDYIGGLSSQFVKRQVNVGKGGQPRELSRKADPTRSADAALRGKNARPGFRMRPGFRPVVWLVRAFRASAP